MIVVMGVMMLLMLAIQIAAVQSVRQKLRALVVELMRVVMCD